MKIEKRRNPGFFLAALSTLAVGALACSLLPFGLGGQDGGARIATLEAQLQDARAEATAKAESAAPDESTEQMTLLEEDFESESSGFLLGEGATLHVGALRRVRQRRGQLRSAGRLHGGLRNLRPGALQLSPEGQVHLRRRVVGPRVRGDPAPARPGR